jgi:transcriptional regulator with XRE-family HTH domain
LAEAGDQHDDMNAGSGTDSLGDSVGPIAESAPAPAATTGKPARVGATLRAAREAAGIDIAQMSARTRVTARHLEALEAGDYASLPGRPYAIGFARSHARALGLDDGKITDAVRAELDAQAPSTPARAINQFDVGDPAKTPSRLTAWLAAVLALAIVLVGLIFWRSYYLPAADLPALAGTDEPKPESSQVAVVRLPAARPTGPVVFTATEERIWVKFYDGQGQQILQKELAKGESFTIPDTVQGPQLWTARPDALAITIGGQPVPRLAEREGIVKDVPVSAQALLSRTAPQAVATTPAPAPLPRTPAASPPPPTTVPSATARATLAPAPSASRRPAASPSASSVAVRPTVRPLASASASASVSGPASPAPASPPVVQSSPASTGMN